MKKLIIFYSLEGNTQFIAESIASAIDADLLRLSPKKEINHSNIFTRYFYGGKQVFSQKNPELLPIDKNISDYNFIFIGTPVWAFTYAPALSTFFANNTLKDKKIALFCCHGGGKGKTFSKMAKALEGNEIISEIDFQEPLINTPEKNKEKAQIWAKAVIEKMSK